MKQLQVLLTIDVDSDDYTEVLNETLSIETLVHHMLENGDDGLSFSLPTAFIDQLTDE